MTTNVPAPAYEYDEFRNHLLGAGLERGGAWSELLGPAGVVLSSAACHSLYPLCSGKLPWGEGSSTSRTVLPPRAKRRPG